MHDIEHAYQMGYEAGYQAALQWGSMATLQMRQELRPAPIQGPAPPPKPKRKVSAYHKRLGREIKALRKRHMTKAGKWKKGWSQKRMMKTAHKNAK